MIQIKNITKSFGDKIVLNNLSADFEVGKIIKMLVTGKRQEGLIGNIIV